MTYVLSDIHGNLRRFESIMAQINLQPDDTLYVLGDVIDRYPDGIKILRRIMQMLWRVGQMSFYEQISYNRFTRSLGNAQRREARLYDVKVAR